jgi:hypothetical protein
MKSERFIVMKNGGFERNGRRSRQWKELRETALMI